jgi:hypothetical protein
VYLQEQLMKRVLVLVTALSLLIPSAALASSSDESSKNTAPALSLKAQGIQAAAAHARAVTAEQQARSIVVAPNTPAPAQNGRSFWKSPWPYVIIGAAVVVAVVAAKGGYGNGEGSGY